MRALVVIVSLFLIGTSLQAQQRELTPFIGWQEGGSLEINNDATTVDGAPLFGVMLSFAQRPETRLDFVFSHQESEAASGDFADEFRIDDVRTDYLHVGGRYLFKPGERFNPYIALTLGGTRVAVADEYVVALSFAGGAGADIELSRALALRLDGRYYTTLSNTRTEFACGDAGICTILNEGQTYNQFAATAGLVFKF